MIDMWTTPLDAKSRRVKFMLPWLWKSVSPDLELCSLNDATSIPAKDIESISVGKVCLEIAFAWSDETNKELSFPYLKY